MEKNRKVWLVIGLAAAVGFVFAAPVVFRWRARHCEPTAQVITCERNLKQIGLAFKMWALDHGDQFPFNVSTNEGGTRELCVPGSDGFDANAAPHLQVMTNQGELTAPAILICPRDWSKKKAASFSALKPGNVTYRIRTGANVSDATPQEVLAVCPVDGNTLYCDGTVRKGTQR